MHDVAVIGGGPVGSHIAARLAGHGYDVVVLERKQFLSEPVCCTGIIGRECVDSFSIDEDVVWRWVNGAHVLSPSRRVVKLWRPTPQAAIVDRVALNISLSSRAKGRGVTYSMDTHVRGITMQDDRVNIEATQCGTPLSFDARVAVVATGFSPKFIEDLGLGRTGDSVMGAQAEVIAPGIEDIEVYCSQKTAPGFFAWLVPTTPGYALAGLLSRRSPGAYLDKFLSSLETQGKIASVNTEPMHWGISLKPPSKTYGQRLLVVGTAAGQVKPTTGGGIYYGLLCADIAANHLHRSFVADDLSARNLSGYERDWKKKLGHELRIGYWARKVYEHLDDGQIEKIFDIIQSSAILDDLQNADELSFDWHGGAVFRVTNYQVFLKTIAAMNIPGNLMKRLTGWSSDVNRLNNLNTGGSIK